MLKYSTNTRRIYSSPLTKYLLLPTSEYTTKSGGVQADPTSVWQVNPHPRCSCCSSAREGGCCTAWTLRSSGGRAPCRPARPSAGVPSSPATPVWPLLSRRWRRCTACTQPSYRWSRCAGVLSAKTLQLLCRDRGRWRVWCGESSKMCHKKII